MRILGLRKRGQAALEFLTTYGWAFLVILVMIGALAYFGVLSPANFLPERCLFPAGFQCNDFRLVNDGGNLDVDIALANSMGKAITVNNVTTVASGEVDAVTCTVNGGASATLSSDEGFDINCDDVTGTIVQGEKLRVRVSFDYVQAGSTFVKTSEGEMFGEVQ